MPQTHSSRVLDGNTHVSLNRNPNDAGLPCALPLLSGAVEWIYLFSVSSKGSTHKTVNARF